MIGCGSWLKIYVIFEKSWCYSTTKITVNKNTFLMNLETMFNWKENSNIICSKQMMNISNNILSKEDYDRDLYTDLSLLLFQILNWMYIYLSLAFCYSTVSKKEFLNDFKTSNRKEKEKSRQRKTENQACLPRVPPVVHYLDWRSLKYKIQTVM